MCARDIYEEEEPENMHSLRACSSLFCLLFRPIRVAPFLRDSATFKDLKKAMCANALHNENL